MNKYSRKLTALRTAIITCQLCPRLVEHRQLIGLNKSSRFKDWDYWAKPIPGFGHPDASLMIVGLAPAAHGANRTGRVFTGDSSARFLMSVLFESGFASQSGSENINDGLKLYRAYMSTAIRCVPPADRPLAKEQQNCRPYLISEIKNLPELRFVVALGHIAFNACIKAFGELSNAIIKAKFIHGETLSFGNSLPLLTASYHPSPRNTNTGKLTRSQLLSVFTKIKTSLSREVS